ncbi:MAG: hypothetical protein ACOH5I_00135 [Oligoflexus sp.]
MSLILTFLLATTTLFVHAKNGETGVLIGVQNYRLMSYESEQFTETLQLCDELIEVIYLLQDAGYTTHLNIKELGQFTVNSTENGELNLEGYATKVDRMSCLDHAPSDNAFAE